MKTKTANKVRVFLVKSLESKREPKYGSSNTLTSKANVKEKLAALDQEAKELINQIFDMVEIG